MSRYYCHSESLHCRVAIGSRQMRHSSRIAKSFLGILPRLHSQESFMMICMTRMSSSLQKGLALWILARQSSVKGPQSWPLQGIGSKRYLKLRWANRLALQKTLQAIVQILVMMRQKLTVSKAGEALHSSSLLLQFNAPCKHMAHCLSPLSSFNTTATCCYSMSLQIKAGLAISVTRDWLLR